MHRVRIPQDVLDRIAKRRGRLHPFEKIEGRKTALVVIDLQNAFMLPGMPAAVKDVCDIIPNVNHLAEATRAAGGKVVWVKMTLDGERQRWSVFFDHFGSATYSAAEQKSLSRGDLGHELHAELDVAPGDLTIEKSRFSAFIQGSSELDATLRRLGIDTVLIVGTVTNTCCESSARDAMMLNYRTIMVSDANAAHSDEEHNATLTNILRIFGDVRTTDEVVHLLAEGTGAPAAQSAAVSA
ncbi:MAG TPA: isochorismatase family cysteine hydrolase [Stellaceae bacterium]|nr:isochorismatase family cysteine hydrolase [Stellaceae bacterium]